MIARNLLLLLFFVSLNGWKIVLHDRTSPQDLYGHTFFIRKEQSLFCLASHSPGCTALYSQNEQRRNCFYYVLGASQYYYQVTHYINATNQEIHVVIEKVQNTDGIPIFKIRRAQNTFVNYTLHPEAEIIRLLSDDDAKKASVINDDNTTYEIFNSQNAFEIGTAKPMKVVVSSFDAVFFHSEEEYGFCAMTTQDRRSIILQHLRSERVECFIPKEDAGCFYCVTEKGGYKVSFFAAQENVHIVVTREAKPEDAKNVTRDQSYSSNIHVTYNDHQRTVEIQRQNTFKNHLNPLNIISLTDPSTFPGGEMQTTIVTVCQSDTPPFNLGAHLPPDGINPGAANLPRSQSVFYQWISWAVSPVAFVCNFLRGIFWSCYERYTSSGAQ
jgi:hypothetical protein